METPLMPHIVIFPFMAEGHTLPLLDLSKALSSKNIKITIITTPSNSKSILQKIENHPNINLTEISFPTVDGLPKGCENTSQLPSFDLYLPFLISTKKLKEPFEQVLQSMKDSNALPVCVISDFFLGFTLSVCQAYSVPRLVFHGMGVLSMSISKTAFVHAPHLESFNFSDRIDLPGLNLPFVLTKSDLPDGVVNAADLNDPFIQFLSEVGEADINSWGIIVNTFEELERSHIPPFEAFYNNGARAWCVGPLFLYGGCNNNNNKQNDNPSSTCCSTMITNWLNEQAVSPGSVIYVSFGTQAEVCEAQLDEVALGLEESGHPFIWVVRSKTWNPPEGLEERIRGKGLIAREFVNQKEILWHRAVGGFLSHCGWNSVLESVTAGVPILAWPMIAEQNLNAKFVVEGLGAGVGMRINEWESKGNGSVSVWREGICEGVKELMGGGEKGRNARERAEALGCVARRAVQEGGSSHRVLDQLIQQLIGSES
ncbi:hypothetical protein FEM48_Zijuj06G0100100 [Ziziphus jujuba var. spinosa]|uniref:Glycosyltransferase n=1 Tax=Ziziphus jujuba var. spinosa TaxID=714518 RepID=A0A978V8M2_ZIZJJ|nr:hypothetical protein FEM48_Zijuj06G0100100 [Ziziphus jujuba var. spinosa]